jgi:cyclic pyranopterin phosphate synthase
MTRKAKAKALAPTHLDAAGRAHVVDVGGKASTRRRAEARATVATTAEVARAIRDGQAPKGDVSAVARIAGILGAKRTSELVPLCHPISLTHVAADLAIDIDARKGSGTIDIRVRAECKGQTGVEMEAMTGASIAALTVYDMIKGLDREAAITRVELLEKSGGRSGHWRRS